MPDPYKYWPTLPPNQTHYVPPPMTATPPLPQQQQQQQGIDPMQGLNTYRNLSGPNLTSGPNNGSTSFLDAVFGGGSSAPGFTQGVNYAGVPDEAFFSSSGAPASTTGQAAAGGFGGSGVGMSNWAGGATPLLYAYMIGKGKMMENDRLKQNPNDPLGNFGLAMLAPSGKQILKDPKGMGLPTLLGAPFLTPFTASKEAKQTSPEWAGMWNSAGLGGGK